MYCLFTTILALTCLHKKYTCCYGVWEGLFIQMPFEEIYSKAPIYHKSTGETAVAHLWWCFHFCSQGLYVISSCWNTSLHVFQLCMFFCFVFSLTKPFNSSCNMLYPSEPALNTEHASEGLSLICWDYWSFGLISCIQLFFLPWQSIQPFQLIEF